MWLQGTLVERQDMIVRSPALGFLQTRETAAIGDQPQLCMSSIRVDDGGSKPQQLPYG
jgi:hypothetical protein